MICNVGINDMPIGWANECELNSRIYQVWRDMIRRCYDKKVFLKNPTYKECYVCDKWINLSGFVEDISKIDNYETWKNNPKKRISLDKDVKSNGTNKKYCLENCIFISSSENSKQATKTQKYIHMQGENNPMYGKHGKDNKKSKKVVQYQNGQIVCIYDSIKEAKDKTGIVQISNSCTYYNKGELWWKQNRSGRPNKSAGGYVWKYLSDVSDDERLVYIIKKILIEVNENEKK